LAAAAVPSVFGARGVGKLAGFHGESEWDEFNRLLATKRYEEVKKMRASSYELGRREGHRELLRELLEQRFGPLSKPVRQRLQSLPTERLETLFKKGLRAQSLGELGLEDDR